MWHRLNQTGDRHACSTVAYCPSFIIGQKKPTKCKKRILKHARVVVASWELRVSRIGDSNGIAYDTRSHHGNGTGLHGFPLTATPWMTRIFCAKANHVLWSGGCNNAVASCFAWSISSLSLPAHSSHRQIFSSAAVDPNNTLLTNLLFV